MHKPFNLRYLDYYVPKDYLTVEDFVSGLDEQSIPANFSNREDYLIFLDAVLGLNNIKTERSFNQGEMLGQLIEKMIDENVLEPKELDLIITTDEVVLSSKDNFGKFIQCQYGFENAFVMNVSGNHCANIAMAWDLINRNYHNSGLNNVLIVNTSLTQVNDDRVIGSYGVLGDGAGLMLLQRGEGLCTMVDNISLSNGSLHKVDMGKDYSLVHLKYSIKCIRQLFEKNNIDSTNIIKVISQNANPLLITNAMMECGLNYDKIFTDNLGTYGHIGCLDMIINLKDMLNSNDLHGGDHIMLYNMGWAGSYVSSLLQLN